MSLQASSEDLATFMAVLPEVADELATNWLSYLGAYLEPYGVRVAELSEVGHRDLANVFASLFGAVAGALTVSARGKERWDESMRKLVQ